MIIIVVECFWKSCFFHFHSEKQTSIQAVSTVATARCPAIWPRRSWIIIRGFMRKSPRLKWAWPRKRRLRTSTRPRTRKAKGTTATYPAPIPRQPRSWIGIYIIQFNWKIIRELSVFGLSVTPRWYFHRLRRDSESAVVVVNSKDSEKPASAAAATQGRDSSASSGSSSETLKWHGSNSDLSTVSSSGHRATTQLIAHSAKVSAPQRHHSESVLSVTDGWSGVNVQEHRVGNQRNLRKLFPVSTYTVQPAMVVDEKTSPKYERLHRTLYYICLY